MIRPARSFRRRLAVGAIVVGLAAIGPVATTLASGAADPGSGLGSVNVHAVAVGLRMPLYSHQGEDGEAELPYAVSDLGGGGIAHALTSFFWPGSTGASVGSTLAVIPLPLPVTIPQQLENALNDPFKAEAPTTQGQTKVSLSKPGFTMQALALPTHVNAVSAVGLSQVSSFKNNAGPIVNASTNIAFQGANTVVADAQSALSDITIGPLSIGSIVSAVHATSDGKHATGTTTTEIVGATVAGVGVTVGHDGVTVANKGALPASVVTTLTKTVNSALKQAGLSLFVTPGSKLAHGAQISLDAGELMVNLHKPGYRSGVNDTGMLMELGGASITANAIGAYVAPPVPSIAPTPGTVSNNNTGGGSTGVPSLGNIGQGSTTMPPPPGPAPVLAANPLSLPGPLSSWWVVLGALLAVGTAFLLSLLPGRALVAGASCRLEEES